MRPRLRAALAVAVVAAGCSTGTDGTDPAASGPVEVVKHAYYPRLVTEDFWETVRLEEVGDRFLLIVRPRIRTPAEGPWIATFRGPDGAVLATHRGLRVDVATGSFTFLCNAADFAPGDWNLDLEVEPGGLVSGERKRAYRFRVQ